jgi:DNA processing protein
MESMQGMDSNELLLWVGLRLIPQVGSVRFMKLVEAFGSPSAVFKAPEEQLLAAVPRMPL